MPDWSWHISFLNTVEDALYYAYGDSSVLTGVENPDKPIPRPLVYKLHQNYPNPFNPQTKIIYSIPKSGLVKLSIYDVQGLFVRTLVNENKPAGEYFVSWDAKNDHGPRVASGVYFVRLVFDGRIQAKKMVLLQ
ncbi:MAG: T9SS type A sorting domain-containing protein [Candidatus Latescibacteria bacterium]|nr:T9SS type A sorting domain-containing protein [Candidatus Latescibacterota bacterium]NIO56138.1 T9SS type A sorting domain-containing protein [Candidatus Latescibacterota bacterium]